MTAADTRQVVEAGESALARQRAAVPESPCQGAGSGKGPAIRVEQRRDVERGFACGPARVVAGPRVPRQELLAHVEQDVVEHGRVVGDHRGDVVHALPGVGVEHRHSPRDGVDDAVQDADLEIGVVVEAVGQRVSHVVAERGDQDLAVQFLEFRQCVVDRLLGLSQESHDRLDLALGVVQNRDDVAGDVLRLAAEQARDGVDDRVDRRQPLEDPANGVLRILDRLREFPDPLREI
ncbi:hypothetical protein [Mycolicibacterium arenosum]|uniref:Uncharacterized protein n=1 Tax=Mycolicibacterium arenosum TaxID=2952157 RepID=A0ABT1M3V5_9MYCO|nr:hypothetical protein [Mycolicibacterium sp. CAU 1645]MCP9273841.1 hypothetical protein [Mycolicibacterium sp. CAU 1645]